MIHRLPFLVLVALLPLSAPALSAQTDNVELIVVKGDNLSDICRNYLRRAEDWREVGKINHLRNCDLIRPGQRLLVPVRLMKGIPAEGRVAYVLGDVAVRPPGSSRWLVLRRNDTVVQGSTIRTGQDSSVEFVFEDGTSILQRQETVLGLKESELKGKSHLLRRLQLSTGRLISKVRRATGRETRFEIRTPSATAVSRGTEFRVASGRHRETTSEVLEGAIDVTAMGKAVRVNQGEGTRIDVGHSPTEPRRLLPPPSPPDLGTPFNSMPARINFEPAAGAVSYRFVLSRDRDGKDLLQDKVYGANQPATFTGLEDGRYFVRTTSIDDMGLEGLSHPPREITVRTNPKPPFIQSPAQDSRNKGSRIQYSWLRVTDAVRYQVQTSRDPGFARIEGTAPETADTGLKVAITSFGNYYFRVRSVAADGYAGAWSDAIPYAMIPPPPVPELEKPEVGKGELRIRFAGSGGKATYHCQVSMNGDFKDPILDRKLEQPELVMPRPDQPGVYYVRASTIDSEGFEGEFSPSQTFEIRRYWPYAVGGAIGLTGVLILILL